MRRLVLLFALAACDDKAPSPMPDATPPPTFAQAAYIKSSQPMHDAHFGNVALSGDGRTLVGSQRGAVTVYVRDGSWRVATDLTPSTPKEGFGSAIAISSDGLTIAVSTLDTGSVFVFRNSDGVWIEDSRIDDDVVQYTEFGTSLALSSDGNLLAVRSRDQSTDAGRVSTFRRTGATWSRFANFDGGFHFGTSFAMATDGNVFAATVYHSGAIDSVVEVYVRSGDIWTKQAELQSPVQRPNAEFGTAVACSAKCETIVISALQPEAPAGNPGAPGAGTAYVFTGDGSTWAPTGTIVADNAETGDKFGMAVAISDDGSIVVVGAPAEFGENNAAPYAGAAYVFRHWNGAWPQVLYLKGSNTEQLDIFGSLVAVSKDATTIAVSALYEAGGSSGVNGDETDNSQPYAGAIYAFEGAY